MGWCARLGDRKNRKHRVSGVFGLVHHNLQVLYVGFAWFGHPGGSGAVAFDPRACCLRVFEVVGSVIEKPIMEAKCLST